MVAVWDNRALRPTVYLIGILTLVPVVFLFFSGFQRASGAQSLPLVVALFGVGSLGLIVLYATTVLPRRAALAGCSWRWRHRAVPASARDRLAHRGHTPPRREHPHATRGPACRNRGGSNSGPLATCGPDRGHQRDDGLRPLLQWRLRDVSYRPLRAAQPPLGTSAILDADTNRTLLAGRRVARSQSRRPTIHWRRPKRRRSRCAGSAAAKFQVERRPMLYSWLVRHGTSPREGMCRSSRSRVPPRPRAAAAPIASPARHPRGAARPGSE